MAYPQPPMDPRASFPYNPPPAIPPGLAPPPPMGWPSQTEKGVRHISYTMIIFAIVSAVVIVVVASLASILSGFLATPPPGPPDPGLLGALLALLAGSCALIILYIAGLVFGLLGLLAVHRGENEFGPDHQRKVTQGTIALVLGIVVPMAGGAATAASSLASAPGLLPATTLAQSAVSAAFGIAGTVLVGLALLWLIERLLNPAGRQLAWVAFGLGLVATLVAALASFAILASFPPVPQPGDIMLLFIPLIASQAVSIASIVMWYIVYRGVLERFRRGELRAAPPPMPYSPYYPPYYPAPTYAPPYVPAQPPPAPPEPSPPPEPAEPEEPPKEKPGETPPEGG